MLTGIGVAADDRLRAAAPLRRFLRKIFPDHWSFLLGEIALYTFIILVLTGTLLSLWFQPSMTEVIYHGSYTRLNGIRMTQAYASTLHISFDVRGGLLLRQIHHWAADLFVAAIAVHMLRIFFTGAFRKPRELNWLIGITLFALAVLEGYAGYSLPDDLLSGTGLRIFEGVLLSIPIVGTYVTFFAFGGQYPGSIFVPRLYIAHVLLIPGLLLALISAHLFIMFHQKHTQMPGKGRTNANVVGAPMYPYFIAKTTAFMFFVFGVLALLATFAQINPIWLYGPYTPSAITADSQPDWYMGFLEGALRMFPNWNWNLPGHTVAFNVLIPGLLVFGLILTALALVPFLERWVTGDTREHHVNDRPRNAATRTALGMAGVTFYGLLWLVGSNDVIAYTLNIPLYWITWFGRVAIFAGPVIAYIVTKRICLGLQRQDRELLVHGVETGIIRQLPSGGYTEVTRPVDADHHAILVSRTGLPEVTGAPAEEREEVPLPAVRSGMGRLRVRLNLVFREGIPLTEEEAPDGGGGDRQREAAGKGPQVRPPAG